MSGGDVSGLRYLVTGAGSGIGREVTRLLLAAGHTVVGLDRGDVPDGCEPLRCDLTHADAVARAAAAVRDGGPLHGVANVAGVPGTAAPDVVLTVNFLAARALTEALVDHVAPDGAVVEVASLAARRPTVDEGAARRLFAAPDADVLAHAQDAGLDGSVAYDLSKRLLVLYATALAARRARTGPRVCSVSPGPIETPILGDFRTSMGETVEMSAAAVGRHGRAEEVAAAVVFLLSPAASWVNGVDLTVDGGLIAMRETAKVVQSVAEGAR